jgi:hypothetical protein
MTSKATAFLADRIGKDALALAELLQVIERQEAEIAELRKRLEEKEPAP